MLGCCDGSSDGKLLGCWLGTEVVGSTDGAGLGCCDGPSDGALLGCWLGSEAVGSADGALLGCGLGTTPVGSTEVG